MTEPQVPDEHENAHKELAKLIEFWLAGDQESITRILSQKYPWLYNPDNDYEP